MGLNFSDITYKKYWLSLLFLIVTVFSVRAQTKEEAIKLQQQLSTAKNDIKKVKLLLALGKYSLFKEGEYKIDLDSASLFTNQARILSTKLNYKTGVGQSILQEAKIYRERGNKKKAWDIANNALNYFTKNSMPVLKGDTYMELKNHYSQDGNGIFKQIEYNELAINLYRNYHSKKKEADALVDIADLYQAKGDTDGSLSVLQEALAIYKTIKFKRLQGVYIYIASMYRLKNDTDTATEYALLAAKTAESLKDDSMQLCMIYNHIGLIYHIVKKYAEADIYFKKALAVAYKHKDNKAINELSQNIAADLYRNHKYSEAIKILNNAVTEYPCESIEVAVIIDHQFTLCYLYVKDFVNAEKYYNKLIHHYNNTPDTHTYRAQIFKGIITYLRETGRYKKTYKYLDEYAAHCGRKKFLKNYSDMEHLYFQSDSAAGNFRGAFNHLKKHQFYKDSITSLNRTKQVNALQIKYETEKKDKDIALLMQQSHRQDVKINNSIFMQYVFTGGLILSGIIILLLYYAYRLKQRSNKKLEFKRQQIDEQNEMLRKLLTEKEWLLKEIHHRVKNNLQIVISLLNTQSSFLDNEEALEAIHNSQHRMHAMSLIHQKLYQSENLASINIAWYISELVNYLKECLGNNKKIKFTLNTEEIELDVAQAVPLGLILNEAISNAIKYAFPENVTGAINISLRKTLGNTYKLIVSDDGIGLSTDFDPDESNSLGMNLMQGLSEQLDGSFNIKNDQGVCVEITFKKNQKFSSINSNNAVA